MKKQQQHRILIGSLALLSLVNHAACQTDEDYNYAGVNDENDGYDDYEDYGADADFDACSFYHDDHSANGECHHQAFPATTLAEVFHPSVKQCCGTHAYMFYDNCEVIW